MRAAVVLLLSAGTASAAPFAHLDQDVDGDGKIDHVSAEPSGDLVIEGASRIVLPLRAHPTSVTLSAATVRGTPMLVATTGAPTSTETVVFEYRGGAWHEVVREPTGPVPPDGEYSIAIAPGPNGIYRYQQRAGIRRCDGAPTYLFADGWTGKRFQRLAKLPTEVADTAPVLAAHLDSQPVIAPLLYQARAASYEPGVEDASALAIPSELDDGRPTTSWREELSSIGEGQFFTFEPRSATAKATQLRVVAADGKGLVRARRLAVVGATKAWHVDLADTDAAQTIDLPQPIDGCVTVVIETAYGSEHGTLAIGELEVFGEGERNGDGEATLAKMIAEGGDIKMATQALARRGHLAVAALETELGKATSIAARTRLVRALTEIDDPSVGAAVGRAIAADQVEDTEVDNVLAALGAKGFSSYLHDVAADQRTAMRHRAAAARALIVALTADPRADRNLLLDLAGAGTLEVRRAVIDGLATLPVALLLPPAQTIASPEASGDLLRAITRRARTHADEAAPALAAFSALLATATDYERRSRIVDGLAAFGDGPALAALAKLLRDLPIGSARFAFDQVAASAIAKAPRPDALALLLVLVGEPDPGVRYAAISALGATGTEAGPAGTWHTAVHADGVDRVIQTALASDTWPEVRARAAQMLGARCGRPGPARSLDDAVHRDPELAVRSDALGALVECKASLAGDLVTKTWDNTKQPLQLRQHAIDLAVELGDRVVAATLVTRFAQWRGAALESAEALALAQNAAYAIGRLGPTGAGDALLGALDDGAFPEIVAAAATGLGLMGPACPAAAKPKLRVLAHSDDQQIQLAAAHAAALCGK